MEMEGTIWKWTNYWKGWQPRWFVLENGVLSYYSSQEEVNQGSKGSIKVTVCDIVAHATDYTRLDVGIPGEQYFYLKFATPQERQQWLIALGSSKAALGSNHHRRDSGGSKDQIRSKKYELRLYCDLLMQQVHSVKTVASEDVTKLDESTGLLSATCDTFIKTLEELMEMVDHSMMPLSPLAQMAPVIPHMKKNSRVHHDRQLSVDK